MRAPYEDADFKVTRYDIEACSEKYLLWKIYKGIRNSIKSRRGFYKTVTK